MEDVIEAQCVLCEETRECILSVVIMMSDSMQIRLKRPVCESCREEYKDGE